MCCRKFIIGSRQHIIVPQNDISVYHLNIFQRVIYSLSHFQIWMWQWPGRAVFRKMVYIIFLYQKLLLILLLFLMLRAVFRNMTYIILLDQNLLPLLLLFLLFQAVFRKMVYIILIYQKLILLLLLFFLLFFKWLCIFFQTW